MDLASSNHRRRLEGSDRWEATATFFPLRGFFGLVLLVLCDGKEILKKRNPTGTGAVLPSERKVFKRQKKSSER